MRSRPVFHVYADISIHRVVKLAPPSFHAEYILRRVMVDGPYDIVTRVLRYPICSMEVFDALYRRPDCPPLRDVHPDLL